MKDRENVNISKGSPGLRFLILAAVVSGCAVALYFAAALIIDVAAPHVPYSAEVAMSHVFMRGVDGVKTRTSQERELQNLLDRLKPCSAINHPVTIHITGDRFVNAFAMPGGNILITKGLLKSVKSENELVFVLCHELGHIRARDNLRGLGRRFLLGLTDLIMGSNNQNGGDATNPLHFTELALTRKQEKAADRFALDTLNCFYGHVGGATDFFESLAKGKKKPKWKQYLSTHPDSRIRIERIRKQSRVKGYVQGALLPVPGLTPEPVEKGS